MPTDMTPEQVRAFLTGESAPTPNNSWPRPDNPPHFGVEASEASGGDYIPRVMAALHSVEEGSATDRAKLRGWSIDPELTPGNPHALNACKCKRERTAEDGETATCACTCHGRTFIHYKRGA